MKKTVFWNILFLCVFVGVQDCFALWGKSEEPKPAEPVVEETITTENLAPEVVEPPVVDVQEVPEIPETMTDLPVFDDPAPDITPSPAAAAPTPVVSAPEPAPVITPPAPPKENQIEKALRSGGSIPIRLPEEEAFDYNGNRRLDSNEIKAFLEETINVVNRTGTFVVRSDLVYQFDSNRDGQINRNEIGSIQSFIR